MIDCRDREEQWGVERRWSFRRAVATRRSRDRRAPDGSWIVSPGLDPGSQSRLLVRRNRRARRRDDQTRAPSPSRASGDFKGLRRHFQVGRNRQAGRRRPRPQMHRVSKHAPESGGRSCWLDRPSTSSGRGQEGRFGSYGRLQFTH